jgi:nucleotide-binding universal stress UspA family protein
MIKSLLIPLDGSDLAAYALKYAADVLPPEGSITLLTVVRVPSTYFATEVPLPMIYTAADITRLLRDELQGAKQYLNEQAKPLQGADFTVYTVVETGDPAIVITEQARFYDAIMMTTHGRTGLRRLLYGSVTQQVIGTSPRPVIVVPSLQSEPKSKDDVHQTSVD